VAVTPRTRLDRLTRARLVLIARHDSVEGLARRLGCTACHIRNLMSDRRGASRRLTEKLLADFGPKAWAFIAGATDRFDLKEIE
jgi:hypothetical protein